MGRPPNQLNTAPLKIATTPQVHGMLQRLVNTGLWGKTPNEAAERLITEGLRGLIQDGVLGSEEEAG
jgi:hypothetical protein